MKEAIERLKMLADIADRYNWIDQSKIEIKMSDVRALIDFYEAHKPLLNVTDITPEWDNVPEAYKFVAIDASGQEFMYKIEPKTNGYEEWACYPGNEAEDTGRKFDMKGIDWKRTLSKRPAKNG